MNNYDASVPTPTPSPKAGHEIHWRGYFLRCEFYPHLKMSRKGSLEFATEVASAIETGGTSSESNEWVIRGAGAHDGMRVVIRSDSIELDAIAPTNALEWYEERFQSILNAFGKRFDLKMSLGSGAMATAQLEVLGDARVFVGQSLMSMNPHSIRPIKRPLHILGLRLYFPPFNLDDAQSQTDWGVDVKIESCIHDAKRLHLEADAHWTEPMQWENDATPRVLVQNLTTVTDFMKGRLLDYLHQSFDRIDESPEGSVDDSLANDDDDEGEIDD